MTSLGIFLLLLPSFLFSYYSKDVFGLSLIDNLKKWSFAKYLAIFIFFLYFIYLLWYGHDYLVLDDVTKNRDLGYYYIESLFIYYLMPGMSLAAIVYAKAVGYFFVRESSFDSCISEDLSFIFGWLHLLYFSWRMYLEHL